MRFHHAVVSFATLSIIVAGCGERDFLGRQPAEYAETRLPIVSYVHVSRKHGEAPPFIFPLLRIYDPSGKLAYSSHDNVANARLLESSQRNLSTLGPGTDQDSLESLLDDLPEFRSQKQFFLAKHTLTLVSVSLENCHACTLQDDSLDKAKKNLLNEGINIISIRVAGP